MPWWLLAQPEIAVSFGVLLMFVALLGMHQGTAAWLRPLLEELAAPRGNFIRKAALWPVRVAARAILKVERTVQAYISNAVGALVIAVAGFLDGIAALAHGIAHEIQDLAEGIEAGIRDLTVRWIPRYVNKALSPVARLARDAWRLGHRVDRYAHAQARRLARGIDTLRRDVRRDIARARRGIEAGIAAHVLPRIHSLERRLARVLTRELPAIRRRERALERAVYGRLTRRLSRLEKLLGLGIITAAVVRTIAKRFPWLFCRNVGKLGRVVCGLDTATMNGLIAALVGTLAIRDYRTLVRLMTDAEREAIEEVRRLLSVD